jgi:hypothetical protein
LQGEKREHWEQLCKQAADEQDPEKLMELVNEIYRLLDEKEQRLKQQKQIETRAGFKHSRHSELTVMYANSQFP